MSHSFYEHILRLNLIQGSCTSLNNIINTMSIQIWGKQQELYRINIVSYEFSKYKKENISHNKKIKIIPMTKYSQPCS